MEMALCSKGWPPRDEMLILGWVQTEINRQTIMSVTDTITVDEYGRMIASGAFSEKNAKRIELIRGELRMMVRQSAEHSELVDQLDDWSHEM